MNDNDQDIVDRIQNILVDRFEGVVDGYYFPGGYFMEFTSECALEILEIVQRSQREARA